MKQVMLLFTMVLSLHNSFSQSVGIGTATPNASAKLDIASTTQGLLVPRMTTSQRFAIDNPANGLLVYDIDYNQLHHYTGTGWTAILNGSYWTRPITSRKRISNINDSVGIGTNSPTEWLDVDGNIRSRINIEADNDVRATGNVIAGNLVSLGNLLVSGTSQFSGAITTNTDFTVNAVGATLQLQTAAVNKGYVQLSGDNLRMGTNSGNAAGNLIIRMNGNDRISINAAGDMDIDGQITKTSVTGSSPLLALCYGRMQHNAESFSGTSNATIGKTSTGVYDIYCTGLVSTSTIVVTMNTYQGPTYATPLCAFVANGHYQVTFKSTTGTPLEAGFSFIAYK